MWKARLQIGWAIASGVYVTVSLVLGLKGVLPDWPWELHYLVGFIVFVCIMSWIIVDKQSQIDDLKAGRPQLAITNTRVGTALDEKSSTLKIELGFFFRNVGEKDAYRFRCSIGYAPEREVSKFRFVDEAQDVNRLLPNSEHETVVFMEGSVKYTERDRAEEVPTSRSLIVRMVSYGDSEHGGKLYEEEWWYSYRADRRILGLMSEEEKNSMEPYARKACGE